MNIQLFLNHKGLIYGGDDKRIKCTKTGTLKIGSTVIDVKANEDCVMPLLFYGVSGEFDATFTTVKGEVYNLEKVAVRSGRILSPPSTVVQLMELTYRADEAEKEREAMGRRLEELSNIFDTNSLNFIIKGENV